MISAFALTVAASNFVSFLAILASSPVAFPIAFMAAWRSSIGEAASTAEAASARPTRLEATVISLLLDMQVSRGLRHHQARCLARYAIRMIAIPPWRGRL